MYVIWLLAETNIEIHFSKTELDMQIHNSVFVVVEILKTFMALFSGWKH